MGTGPFVFKEWIPNDHFTATANPHYWRPGLPHLSQITFKPIPDESARAEALKSGTIDLMITDTPQIITQFRGNKSYSYVDDSGKVAGEPDMNCVQLNCLKAPFNNANVRRAAAMAINRKQYAKVIDDNVLPVSTGLFTPGSPYYSTTSYPAYNPSEATKLVKAAEKQLGGPVSFTFGATNSPAAIRAQEYIQQAWQAVGFQVKNTIVQQNDDINTGPGRHLPGAGLAPVRRGQPRPQLHLLEHDHGQLGLPVHQHGPQRRTPRSRRPCWPDGPPPSSRSARPPTRR